MNELAPIHGRRTYEKSATYSQNGKKISVSYDKLWAAEDTVQRYHNHIGLSCCAVIREYYVNGPKGPALLVLVATNGEGWNRGVYLCMVEDENTEPMFFLDDGESFGLVETIANDPNARQWRFPWKREQHMPLAVDYAREAALNLLSGD